MRTVNATDAKQKFGELLDMAQRGPVMVTSHGRSVAVMISAEDYQAEQARKLALFNAKLERAKTELAEGKSKPMEEFFAERRAKRVEPLSKSLVPDASTSETDGSD